MLAAPPGPDRKEWGLVLAIVLLGLFLRAMFPGRMAVEHFDEGVYASNLWFDADNRFRYPARHLYAPPLMPWLLEWSQVFFGPTHFGTMLVGIASGSLTILLIWWMVRAWFGIPAGIAAACLAAFSDYHAIYSRSALTEPVLCFLLLGSVYFVWISLVKLEFRPAVVCGNRHWVGLVHEIQWLVALGHRRRGTFRLGGLAQLRLAQAGPEVSLAWHDRGDCLPGVFSGALEPGG